MRHRSSKTKQAFARAMIEKRHELGLTQAQLAKKARLPVKDICLYEGCLKTPKIEVVLKLTEVLTPALLMRMSEIAGAGK